MAPAGEGLKYFIKTIPFNFYGWFAALIVPLVILGVIPVVGPMKKAFKRVEEGGTISFKRFRFGDKIWDITFD